MLKNITLTADAGLIKSARERARDQHTTLNSEFRRWLAHYAKHEYVSSDYQSLMTKFSYAGTTQKFTRDEMNER